MTREHLRFLVLEQTIGSGVLNFVINGAIAWAVFRAFATVPLFGVTSIAGDTLATSFVLPFLTALIVSALVARQIASGRLRAMAAPAHPLVAWLTRRSPLRRGALLGVGTVLVAGAPTTLFLAAAGVEGLAFEAFVWFKAGYAGVLGALVTPLTAWAALLKPAAPPADSVAA